MNTQRLLALSLLASVVGLAACGLYGDLDQPPDGTNATLTPTNPTVGLGNELQMTVLTGGGDEVDGEQVDWSSENPEVASIDDTGVVTGVSEGSTVISADWLEAELTKTVNVELQQLEVEPSPATIPLGQETDFEAVTPKAGGGTLSVDANWTSNDSDIAKVQDDSEGIILGDARGTTEVVATVDDISQQAVVNVTEPVQSLVLLPSDPSVPLGGKVCATAQPLNSRDMLIDDADVTWSSSDSSTLEITAGQNERKAAVAGRATGSADLTATSQEVDKTTTANVTPWAQVTTGLEFSCGRTDSGDIYCWGRETIPRSGGGEVDGGMLGNGDGPNEDGTENSPVPVTTSHLGGDNASEPSFTDVDAGTFGACAISEGGSVYCWGRRLGQNGLTTDHKPRKVDDFSGKAVDVSVGRVHKCLVTESGTIQCWGIGRCGQLGSGQISKCLVDEATSSFSRTPRAVTVSGDSPTFKQVTAGREHTCALTQSGETQSGEIYCWGRASFGQLGRGTFKTGDDVANEVDAGPDAGGMFETGFKVGQRDIATTTPGKIDSTATSGSSKQPSPPWQTVVAGQRHTCALDDDNEIFCWGENRQSQSGLNCSYTDTANGGGGMDAGTGGMDAGTGSSGTTYERCARPAHLPFPGTPQRVSPGENVTCAPSMDGTGYCWGWGGVAALGNNDTSDSGSPVEVSGNATYSSFASGGIYSFAQNRGIAHTCGVTSSGRVKCWGANRNGALGNASTGQAEPTPVDIAFGDVCDD